MFDFVSAYEIRLLGKIRWPGFRQSLPSQQRMLLKLLGLASAVLALSSQGATAQDQAAAARRLPTFGQQQETINSWTVGLAAGLLEGDEPGGHALKTRPPEGGDRGMAQRLAERSASFRDQGEIPAVEGIEATLVDFEARQGGIGSLAVDQFPAGNGGEIAHAL